MFKKLLNQIFALMNNIHMCKVIEGDNYVSLRKKE